MWRIVAGMSLLMWCLVGTPQAQPGDLGEGRMLYQKHCGICHGLLESKAASFPLPAPESVRHAAVTLSAAPTLAMHRAYRGEDRRRPIAHAPFSILSPVAPSGIAVAPPFGPPLRGVYGRQAGSVPGFAYSRAFKQILQGIVWDSQTLDRWITDSQAWVPGSLMFYAQPDTEIRRQIIAYVQANR
jgi:cytochrome c2